MFHSPVKALGLATLERTVILMQLCRLVGEGLGQLHMVTLNRCLVS